MKDFLKIGVLGYWPHFFIEDNVMKGSDILMIELLSKKLNFLYNLTVVDTYDNVAVEVNIYHLYSPLLDPIYLILQTAKGTFDIGFSQLSHMHYR